MPIGGLITPLDTHDIFIRNNIEKKLPWGLIRPKLVMVEGPMGFTAILHDYYTYSSAYIPIE